MDTVGALLMDSFLKQQLEEALVDISCPQPRRYDVISGVRMYLPHRDASSSVCPAPETRLCSSKRQRSVQCTQPAHNSNLAGHRLICGHLLTASNLTWPWLIRQSDQC